MTITDEMVAYATSRTTPPRAELAEIAQATRALPAAQMMSGPIVGRLLELLVWAMRPALVLEVGTFTGYAALAMAAALPEGGRLVTCETDPERAAFARARFEASPLGDRVELAEAPALEVAERLSGIDLVWLDGDKRENAALYEVLLERLAPRGLIAADNTLRRGSVLDPADEMARAVDAFNRQVAADPRSVQVLLPVSDGITLIRRA